MTIVNSLSVFDGVGPEIDGVHIGGGADLDAGRLGGRENFLGEGHRGPCLLPLVPTESALAALADDCARMVADGMLLATDESFERLIARSAGIEARANRPEDDKGSAS